MKRLLQPEFSSLERGDSLRVVGRIRRVVGLVAEASGLSLPVGSGCQIESRAGGHSVEAEVIGFRDGRTQLVPFGTTTGIAPGDRVIFEGDRFSVRVGDDLLGRVLDGYGDPIDGLGPIHATARTPIDATPIPPMQRRRIERPLSTGVRALDSLLTVGRGQRMGIFAGSGVGKSVLMGMLARDSEAPVTVIGLIGERGREVREFVERDLGPEGLRRSIVVTATSDEPPVLRLRAARVATAIAEWFRDRGQDVVLLLDSITRVALAQRELGLSASEPPTTRAYPPSVFSLLAQLLERTGPGAVGSITSFYTVLVEADDMNEPIGDAVRGILDGHVWLSRKLATRGHFPAIDVLESVSRVMKDVTTPEHRELAQELIEDLARYRDAEDLIQLGAYAPGRDARTDLAVQRQAALTQLLRQGPEEASDFATAVAQLKAIYAGAAPVAQAQAQAQGQAQGQAQAQPQTQNEDQAEATEGSAA